MFNISNILTEYNNNVLYEGEPHLFVYGTLKKGFPNFHILQSYKPIEIQKAVALNKGQLIDLIHFPAMIPGDQGKVKGQIIKFDKSKMPSLLKELDRIESVDTNLYKRVIMNVFCDAYDRTFKCYTYVMAEDSPLFKRIKDFWQERIIKNGEWRIK